MLQVTHIHNQVLFVRSPKYVIVYMHKYQRSFLEMRLVAINVSMYSMLLIDLAEVQTVARFVFASTAATHIHQQLCYSLDRRKILLYDSIVPLVGSVYSCFTCNNVFTGVKIQNATNTILCFSFFACIAATHLHKMKMIVLLSRSSKDCILTSSNTNTNAYECVL